MDELQPFCPESLTAEEPNIFRSPAGMTGPSFVLKTSATQRAATAKTLLPISATPVWSIQPLAVSLTPKTKPCTEYVKLSSACP